MNKYIVQYQLRYIYRGGFLNLLNKEIKEYQARFITQPKSINLTISLRHPRRQSCIVQNQLNIRFQTQPLSTSLNFTQ